MGAKAWFAWLSVTLFYAYQYVFRVIPGIIMPKFVVDFGISPQDFGLYNSIYYLVYALLHIPIGFIIDRIGTRTILTLSVFSIVLGGSPMIYFHSWHLVLVGRALIAIGSVGCVLGMFRVLRISFGKQRFALMLGITAAIGVLGGVYGGKPLGSLINAFGYREVLNVVEIVGLVLAVFFYVVLPTKKEEMDMQKGEEGPSIEVKKYSVMHDLKTVFCNKMVIFVSILGGLMIAPLEGFADAWSTEFFQVVYGESRSMASLAPSMIFLGFGVGSPLIAWIAGKSKKPYMLLAFCAFMIATIFMLFISGIGSKKLAIVNINLIYVLVFLVGLVSSYQVIVVDRVMSYVPLRLIAITSAVCNMIMMSFGTFFHTTIAELVAYYWDGEMHSGVHVYTAEVLQNSMSVIPVCAAVATLAFVLISVSRHKSEKNGKKLTKAQEMHVEKVM